MNQHRRKQHLVLLNKVAEALDNEKQREALREATKRARDSKKASYAQLGDPKYFREKVKEIKRSSISNLNNLLESFISAATARGAKVFVAKNGLEAIDYIVRLTERYRVRTVVKAKSLTSEEIDINEALEKHGLKVIETDLGERIVQLARERPVHLVAPAIHKTREEITQLFAMNTGISPPKETHALMKMIRESLRETFFEAEMGLTGGNIAIAETGSIIVETNEGNARLVMSLPKVHVVLVGMEKIVATLEDAAWLVRAHALTSTGQKVTTYVTILTGQQQSEDAPDLHIVVLDNGRTAMLADQHFHEALYCIRCGACLNACPTYGVLGGHVFGHIYPGPIGIPLTAGIHGQELAAQISPLCISCGLCKEICPADIDIPMLIARVKERDIKENGELRVNRLLGDSETLAKIGSATSPLSNWLLRRRPSKFLMEKFLGIDSRRPLPKFERTSFSRWFREHSFGEFDRKVSYFVDVFTNYSSPKIGRNIVEVLNRNKIQTLLPEQRGSGMPFISYGQLDRAKDIAGYNVASFHETLRDVDWIVTSEPTAAYCMKVIYPTLLGTRESRVVADKTIELSEYLDILHSRNELDKSFEGKLKGKIGFHISCHSRALSSGNSAIKLLNLMGLEVKVIDYGTCCGMAGTYGLKKGNEGYDVSMEVGKPLFAEFSKEDVMMGVTESSVCEMHLEHGTAKKFLHPIELLAKAYGIE